MARLEPDFYQVMNDMLLSKIGNKPTKENRFNMDRQDINELEEEMHQANQAEIARRKRLEMDERGQISDLTALQKQIREEIREKDLYGARKVMKEIQDREMINHPDHYQGNNFEVIDIIEDYDLGFSLGNAIKYILRADKKDNRKQDLKKAIWYIQREIDREDV
jgi:hypothetical protein